MKSDDEIRAQANLLLKQGWTGSDLDKLVLLMRLDEPQIPEWLRIFKPKKEGK